MEKRNLGQTDLTTSVIGLGCNGFGSRITNQQSTVIIRKAVDAGVKFFDTADIYGRNGSAEEVLGVALRPIRNEMVIATKFGRAQFPNLSAVENPSRFILASLEASLRRLKTDYVDLYQVHAFFDLPFTDDVYHVLDSLIQAGKVRFIGCCNIADADFVSSLATTESMQVAGFQSRQMECNALNPSILIRQGPISKRTGTALLPFLPLGGGLLTGKHMGAYNFPKGSRLGDAHLLRARYSTPNVLRKVEALKQYASKYGRTLLELAFAWLLSEPSVASVVAGASAPEQVAMNIQSSGWRLGADQISELASLLSGESI